MNSPLVRNLCLVTCIFLSATFGLAAQDGAKAVKDVVKASDGVNIVYEVRGKGDTAIIFLHGLCGERHWWKNQVDVFANDYRVVTVDQAGHGESGKDRAKWTLQSLANDVQTVVDKLGLKRVILVGHSMSGPISLAAAKKMPGKVIAVIGVDNLQNVEQKMPEEQSKQILAAFEADFKGTFRGAFRGMFPENADPKLVESILKVAESQDQKMANGLLRDLWQIDSKSLMKDAKVPIRCINSSPTFQFGVATAKDINRKYGDFDAVIMEGTGHFPMLERPDEFNQKLRQVLKEFQK